MQTHSSQFSINLNIRSNLPVLRQTTPRLDAVDSPTVPNGIVALPGAQRFERGVNSVDEFSFISGSGSQHKLLYEERRLDDC